MDLKHGDCLEVMKELETDSVDLMFADLPYGQTSCKWDCLIDLELFWEEVNRVCKPDAPMVFTCTVKFGNTLINSNPKNFRYDLIWVKSASCGFLNAKKMPMKKHEMIYVFYNKLPKVYTENIALHHKHKFLKETNNVIKETNHENAYNTEKRKKPIVRSKPNQYEPPLPNSVIKEDTGVYNECDHSSSKKLVRDTKKYKNESVLYGEIDRPDFMRKKNESMYDPPLPNSVIKEDTFIRGKKNKTTNNDVYNSDERFNNGKLYHHSRKLQKGDESIYEPPLPNSIIKEENVVDEDYENRVIKSRNTIKKEENYGKEYLDKKINFRKYNKKLGGKGEESHLYEPPLPNSILEMKSEKGKHATQKPVALMEWILKYYSREGGVVLDPTMGSGSMGVACRNKNRSFIGIEKDEAIYAVALERCVI